MHGFDHYHQYAGDTEVVEDASECLEELGMARLAVLNEHGRDTRDGRSPDYCRAVCSGVTDLPRSSSS